MSTEPQMVTHNHGSDMVKRDIEVCTEDLVTAATNKTEAAVEEGLRQMDKTVRAKKAELSKQQKELTNQIQRDAYNMVDVELTELKAIIEDLSGQKVDLSFDVEVQLTLDRTLEPSETVGKELSEEDQRNLTVDGASLRIGTPAVSWTSRRSNNGSVSLRPIVAVVDYIVALRELAIKNKELYTLLEAQVEVEQQLNPRKVRDLVKGRMVEQVLKDQGADSMLEIVNSMSESTQVAIGKIFDGLANQSLLLQDGSEE